MVKWIREHQEKQDFDFSTVNWTEMLHIEQLDITEAEPLKVEQQAFLKAVVDRRSSGSDRRRRPGRTGMCRKDPRLCPSAQMAIK